MNPIVIGILGILFLFLLLAMRMQIGFAMALVGFLGFTVLNSFEAGLGVLGIEAFKTASAGATSELSGRSEETGLMLAIDSLTRLSVRIEASSPPASSAIPAQVMSWRDVA